MSSVHFRERVWCFCAKGHDFENKWMLCRFFCIPFLSLTYDKL